jgi:hypothetical protein
MHFHLNRPLRPVERFQQEVERMDRRVLAFGRVLSREAVDQAEDVAEGDVLLAVEQDRARAFSGQSGRQVTDSRVVERALDTLDDAGASLLLSGETYQRIDVAVVEASSEPQTGPRPAH